MPNYVSPGVYTIEKDISEYAPSINTSIVGIVGFAGKGPTNKATLITSQNRLIDTFGEPHENIKGQALEGALEILEQTNSLYFVRAAAESGSYAAADASATMSLGSCPSVIVSGGASFTEGEGFGVGTALTLRIQVYDSEGVAQYTDNDGAGKDFSIPAGTATSQAEAIRKIVGGGLDADKVGCFFTGEAGTGATGLGLSGALVGSFAGSGASMGVSACSGTSFAPTEIGAANGGVSALYAVNALSGITRFGASGHAASAVRVYGSTILSTGTNSAAYKIESLHPGDAYNGGTRTDGTVSGNSITVSGLGSENFNVIVNQNGTTAESFKASFVGSGAFLEDVINTGETNTTSDIIKGNLVKNDADATAASLANFTLPVSGVLGTTTFAVSTRWLEPLTNSAGT